MTTFKTPLAHNNNAMKLLRARIIEQKKLLRLVRSVLPENVARQTRHCLIKNNILLIYADSNVWASKLHFSGLLILNIIKTIAPQVEKVDIRLIAQVMSSANTAPSRKATLPSAKTIEAFRKDSSTVKDEQLKNALLSLSATLARLSKQNNR